MMRALFFFVLSLFLCLHFPNLEGGESHDRQPVLEVFVKEGCTYCDRAKKFLKQFQEEHPEVRIVVHDVTNDPKALAELKAIEAKHPEERFGLPTFRVGDKIIVGFAGPETTRKELLAMLSLNQKVEVQRTIKLPIVGEFSLEKYGLFTFTIIIGFLDGFNPCALWVLLFLLSMLVHLHSRARMLLVAGTFVIVSGIVYFLFMTAWLNFFLLVGMGRWIQIVLGLFALAAGSIHLKDYFAFHKGISLSIPESAKPKIGKQINKVLNGKNLIASLVAVSLLAFLVNWIELLCTAGFPAIYTHILSTQQLPAWQYYGYLILYNIAYIALIAFVVAVAVISFNPKRLNEKSGRILKLVSGLVMIVLALLLLFKPDWLTYIVVH